MHPAPSACTPLKGCPTGPNPAPAILIPLNIESNNGDSSPLRTASKASFNPLLRKLGTLMLICRAALLSAQSTDVAQVHRYFRPDASRDRKRQVLSVGSHKVRIRNVNLLASLRERNGLHWLEKIGRRNQRGQLGEIEIRIGAAVPAYTRRCSCFPVRWFPAPMELYPSPI